MGADSAYRQCRRQACGFNEFSQEVEYDQHELLAGSYVKEVEEDVSIKAALHSFQMAMNTLAQDCASLKSQLSVHQNLWQGQSSPTSMPVSDFKVFLLKDASRDIAKLKEIQEVIRNIPLNHTIRFLRVDIKPFKASLSTWASKFMYIRAQGLHQQVCVLVPILFLDLLQTGWQMATLQLEHAVNKHISFMLQVDDGLEKLSSNIKVSGSIA